MTTEIHDHHRHGRLSQQSTLALKEMVSGAVSGVLAAIVTAPLDLAKTRMQVQQHFKPTTNPGSGIDLRYTSLSGTLARTLREEGARGLFKGLGSTIFGLVPNWAIYFSTYGRLKATLNDGLMDGYSANAVHIVSAIGAGAVTTCATNPIWLIKVRLQTQHTSAESTPKYRGIAHAFIKVFQEEGIRGFYRGLPASLFGVTHVAIQFPLYEALKKYFGTNDPEKQLSLWGLIKASSLSKIVASSITYPHEVVRTRFQKQGTRLIYTSLAQCLRKIYIEEGSKAFFRGMSANLIRVVPACAVTFTSFEYCMRAWTWEI